MTKFMGLISVLIFAGMVYKQLSGLSRERVGVKFIYGFLFSWGKTKHIDKISKNKSQRNAGTVLGQCLEIPGQSCEKVV